MKKNQLQLGVNVRLKDTKQIVIIENLLSSGILYSRESDKNPYTTSYDNLEGIWLDENILSEIGFTDRAVTSGLQKTIDKIAEINKKIVTLSGDFAKTGRWNFCIKDENFEIRLQGQVSYLHELQAFVNLS